MNSNTGLIKLYGTILINEFFENVLQAEKKRNERKKDMLETNVRQDTTPFKCKG